MSKTALVKAIETAIEAHCASDDFPGEWSVNVDEDYVQLVWTCDMEEVPGMYYGDEPWSEWGGNTIIAAAGLPRFDYSGVGGYTKSRYGFPVVSQWVQWNVA
jgi:hypothetical protein